MSGWQPYDRLTWFLEVLPVLIAIPLLWLTRNTFPLTELLYSCIFVHALILIVGGVYSYARVPFGFSLQDIFGLSRNPYDKIGHFFQGFVPALLAREILLRGLYLQCGRMLFFVCLCIAMAVSACYELIEWAAALVLGQNADAFLGSQGDAWDTQSDMFSALLGASIALTTLSKCHDRQIHQLVHAV